MLLWFRNDLRTHDNSALHYFLSQREDKNSGKAIFFVSEKQWQRHHWSAIKIDFIKRHVNQLQLSLAQFGIELMVVHLDTFSDQVEYLANYCQEHQTKMVFANQEVEINEQLRDEQLIGRGVPLNLFEADVIVPKGKVLNKSNEMYKVFTPFKRAWLTYVRQYGFEYFGKPVPQADNSDTQSSIEVSLDTDNSSEAWPLADVVEKQVIPQFFENKLYEYGDQRDIPSIKGTSGLSPYLAAGIISPRYLLRLLLTKYPDILLSTDSQPFVWLNELIWREFYRNLLFHHPRLSKNTCFNLKYEGVNWPNNPEYFLAWKEGRTGYPLVDAAMRQLLKTGWMHNRLRMVVASFLTKHLLIDWRWGEKFFMEHLIDGDLAANNGGWQWAASTGCDAQPYFRVFNPIRQSERFDPEGDFIRMYIPELENVPNKYIHFPHQYIENKGLTDYWPAIVDHKTARLDALAFYK